MRTDTTPSGLEKVSQKQYAWTVIDAWICQCIHGVIEIKWLGRVSRIYKRDILKDSKPSIYTVHLCTYLQTKYLDFMLTLN